MQHLGRQKFHAYCPMIAKRVKLVNRYVEVPRPLFPGYVFVRLSPGRDQWRPVLSTIGVRQLIRFGDRLGLLDDGFVNGLREREKAGVIARPANPFEVGQQVRVSNGPFDGVIATIVAISERDRLIVLMDLLHRKVQVHVTTEQLSAVS